LRCGSEKEVDKEFSRRISKSESQTASIRNDWEKRDKETREQEVEDITGSNGSITKLRPCEAD